MAYDAAASERRRARDRAVEQFRRVADTCDRRRNPEMARRAARAYKARLARIGGFD